MIELEARDRFIACVLVAGFLALAVASMFTPTACGSFHDDAIYVSTAKSLADGGGYNLINLPGAPPQTKYPILYPLLLAGVWKISPQFPGNLWLMQAVTLACAGLFVGASYLYLVRFGYASRRLAFGAVALAGTTPFFLFASTRVLSEMPFGLLLVAALWRLEVHLRNAASGRASQFLMGVLVALPYLCRSIGAVLIAAAVVTVLARRRPASWMIAGIAAVAAPWMYWSLTALGHWQQDNITGYYTDYFGSWSVVADAPGRILGLNVVYLLIASVALGLDGISVPAYALAGWRFGPIFLVAGAAIWLAILIRTLRLELLPITLAAYALLVIAWPWPPARFVLPVLPFFLMYAGRTTADITRALLPTLGTFVLHSALVIALAGNFVLDARFGVLVRQTDFPFPGLPARTLSWASYEAAFAWLRDHSAPDDRIASALDSMVYLYTGRRAFRPFRHRPDRIFYNAAGPPSGTASEVLETLTANHAKYLAVFPIPGFAAEDSFTEVVADIRREHPDRLVPRFIGRDPRFMVFEVK